MSPPNNKRVYLETMGCQMNVLDSELVLGQLLRLGYQQTPDYRHADVVLLNTCSVRQHAEDKVYSRLGEISFIKRRRPAMLVGVIGCMAERDNEGIRQRAPFVDLLCGPGNLNQLPALIEKLTATNGDLPPHPLMALEHDNSRRTPSCLRTLEHNSIEELDASRTGPVDNNALQAYVRVQRGCDKFCSYCVVPYTRGPERNRAPSHIVEETRKLIDAGVKEITLLGQTVNSYAYQENGHTVRFADLLERVHAIAGLQRLRFVTSYPGDFTDDILHAMRDLPHLCEYLHIPAQSGSNAVLKRMKRQYTVEQYLELIAKARQIVPGIAIAGDFIVGFCGETDEEHADTLRMVEQIRYKNLFMFKYSPRPGTTANSLQPDDVPEDVKSRRHAELASLQRRIMLANNRQRVGQAVQVLVEGFSKAARRAQQAEQERGQEIGWKRSDQLTGRTAGDEIVVFTGSESLIGRILTIHITAATALTLHGEIRSTDPSACI